MLTSAVAPLAAAMPLAVRLMAAQICSCVLTLRARMVPLRVASGGMML